MPVANKSGPPTTSGRINGVAKRKRRSITAASSETPPNTENNGSILPASNNTKPRDRGPATTSTVSTISTSERSSHNTPSTKERSQKKTSKSKGDHRDHPKMALQPCISGLGICKDNTSLYAPLGSETGRIPDSGEFDVVELEYPGVNANELFPLLTPAKPLEYNPTKDIYLTTQMIVEHCIPPHLSDALGDVRTGILRSIQRAVHRKSPEDLKASVQQWNEVMVSLKKDQRAFAEGEFTGPAASYQMVSHILEQAYSRSVAPSSGLLNNYEGFSNNVYGEVKHNFVNTIIQEAKIRPHHIFVDMGSGIANVVLQVAAQCLCYSYGIEVMDIPAELAVKQKKEFVSRMRYYAKPCGRIKLRHGDFLEDPNITEVIKSADVIFVNNYAFSAELNQRILGLFLDLKEKATVISLRSFLPVDRPTARSARRSNAIESIFTVKEHYFGRDCVSWMNEGGRYYIHTVDRNQLARRTSMRSSAN
ncbi:histone methylation protein DOT1-domain-containing protein [Powellomyces hirtus]|nr:histone methylation protein DOT1-domain-containing protein [Powellomyces hirtus]